MSETPVDSATRLPARLIDAMRGVAHGRRLNIAYSGGLDSRFLAFAAKRAGFDVRLFHATGPHIGDDETREAVAAAKEMGLTVTLVPVNPLDIPKLAEAGRKRCYVCKSVLMATLLKTVGDETLCDGTNHSDRNVYRPGRDALKELGVVSPLALAEITKSEIREIGRRLGFSNPEQAARPCLLTRFPYGVLPDVKLLALTARIETEIGSYPGMKALRFRLRFPDGLHPALHLEKASLAGIDEGALDAMVLHLKRRFGDELKAAGAEGNIRVEVFETLSGYFDRL